EWLDAAAAVVACHGDLRSADNYVSTQPRAEDALAQLGWVRPHARLLVCGHTHSAMFFGERRGLLAAVPGATIGLAATERCLINPGAVGQARMGLPLASYALLDLDRDAVSYTALEYDHAATVRKLRQSGLVPSVVLSPPRGPVGRRLEHIRLQRARVWAEGRWPGEIRPGAPGDS